MVAITAISDNWGIGYKGGIPWKCKEDFAWFKEFTMNRSIIVGHETFKTLPKLKDRYIKVLTNNIGLLSQKPTAEAHYFSLALFWSIKDMQGWGKDDIVCGGSKVYQEFLPSCDSVYITHIQGNYVADTYFPFSQSEINEMFPIKTWVRQLKEGHQIYKYSKKCTQIIK